MIYLVVFLPFAANAAKAACQCNRMNNGIPSKDKLNGSDWGKYCDDWEGKGDDMWCYVDEGCDDAKASGQFKDSGLFWSASACTGDRASCMAYSKPRPKIKPCPEKEDGGDSKCKKSNTKRKCTRQDGCQWVNDECVGDNDNGTPGCNDCCGESKPSTPAVSNNMPWGGTQSPDYWFNCVSRWCSKYTWMGGPDQCHYDSKYGCGCESLKYRDCMKSMDMGEHDCCWAGHKTGCQEKIECPRLTFGECLEHSDRCAPCGNGGCSYKCRMGPGQNIPGFQSLVLDANCNCKVTQMF